MTDLAVPSVTAAEVTDGPFRVVDVRSRAGFLGNRL